jgi:hypothetical protein
MNGEKKWETSVCLKSFVTLQNDTIPEKLPPAPRVSGLMAFLEEEKSGIEYN